MTAVILFSLCLLVFACVHRIASSQREKENLIRYLGYKPEDLGGFKKRMEAYVFWAKQHRDHPIVQSVETALEQIYANVGLSEPERLRSIGIVLENGYRLMREQEGA